MQINVLGDERRRRWSYDEKVRLVEETLQAGEAVCAGAGWLIACLFTWRRQMDQRRQLHRSGSARPLSRGIATLPTIMHSPRVRHADISEACRISPSFAVDRGIAQAYYFGAPDVTSERRHRMKCVDYRARSCKWRRECQSTILER